MNIYFFNVALRLSYTGIESSSLLRSKLFIDNLDLYPLFFIANYNHHQFSDIEHLKKNGKYPSGLKYVSIYDLIQSVDREKSLFKSFDFSLNENWSIVNVKGYKDQKIFNELGDLVMYVVYNKVTGYLNHINYFNKKNGKNIKIQRDFYDTFGFVSCRQFIDEETGKVNVEIYFRPDGSIALVKRFHFDSDNKKVEQIFLYDSSGFLIKIFESESELVFYITNDYFSKIKEDCVFVVDKNITFFDILLRVKKNKKNSKLIPVIHNQHYFDSSNRFNRNYKSIFDNIEHVDKLVVLTDTQKNKIKEKFSIDKVVSIPHPCTPINNKDFDFVNKFKVIYFARYNSDKRHDLAIDAFQHVVEKIPQATLHCYGVGALKNKLEEKVKALGLSNNIFVNGWCENVNDEYQSASLSIVSSGFECFPLTILESFSNSRPVVAFDVDYGPRSLIVSGENGFLAENNNVLDFAEKIIKILTNDGLRQSMFINAKKTSLIYSYEKTAQKWHSALYS